LSPCPLLPQQSARPKEAHLHKKPGVADGTRTRNSQYHKLELYH
jgi:hypothetical protein